VGGEGGEGTGGEGGGPFQSIKISLKALQVLLHFFSSEDLDH
jgi:hypothetical protein